MEDEVHPAIALLLKRMETHPEEFPDTLNGRWRTQLAAAERWASESEATLLQSTLRRINLRVLEDDILDEMMNGPDRRAAYEAATKQAQLSNAYANQLSNAYANQLSNAYASQNTLSGSVWPQAGAVPASTPMLEIKANGDLQWGNGETLTPSLLGQIKRKLGL